MAFGKHYYCIGQHFVAKDVRVDNRLSDVLPTDHETNRAGRY